MIRRHITQEWVCDVCGKFETHAEQKRPSPQWFSVSVREVRGRELTEPFDMCSECYLRPLGESITMLCARNEDALL